MPETATEFERRFATAQAETLAESDIASLCAAEFAGKICYVEALRRWLLWDEAVWRPDSTLAVFDRIRGVCDRLRSTADKKSAAMLGQAATVAAVERLLKADRRCAATQDQWDVDPMLLNTPTGIVDLRTGKLNPHDPGQFLSKLTSVGPGDECPRWLEFLRVTTGGDDELIAFLRRMAGYALSGSVREHALFFLFGTGGNGKGVFIGTLQGIVGDYGRNAMIETFTDSFSDRHPAELAALCGARMVVAQETDEGRRWKESLIKHLTGGDRVTARYMRGNPFEFAPSFKLVIVGNHKPKLRNPDDAMRRRMHMVPFAARVPDDQRDPDLPVKLREEWPGILRWAIEGCLEWQRHGLNPPTAVRTATEEYFADQNVLDLWIAEGCKRAPGLHGQAGPMFGAWSTWAEAENVPARDATWFKEELSRRGHEQRTSRGRRQFVGIALRPVDGSHGGGEW